jgi:hypothetical protein
MWPRADRPARCRSSQMGPAQLTAMSMILHAAVDRRSCTAVAQVTVVMYRVKGSAQSLISMTFIHAGGSCSAHEVMMHHANEAEQERV